MKKQLIYKRRERDVVDSDITMKSFIPYSFIVISPRICDKLEKEIYLNKKTQIGTYCVRLEDNGIFPNSSTLYFNMTNPNWFEELEYTIEPYLSEYISNIQDNEEVFLYAGGDKDFHSVDNHYPNTYDEDLIKEEVKRIISSEFKKPTLQLVMATRNEDKVREFEDLVYKLKLPCKVRSMAEFTECWDVLEDGSTYSDNAYKKAKHAYEILNRCNITNYIVISDDSGIEVGSLNNNPGIMSARYAGEGASPEDVNNKILKEMKECEDSDRSAKIVTSICVISNTLDKWLFSHEVKGKISEEPRGDNGFAYDRIFIPDGNDNKTLGEVDKDTKSKFNPRVIALEDLLKNLKK